MDEEEEDDNEFLSFELSEGGALTIGQLIDLIESTGEMFEVLEYACDSKVCRMSDAGIRDHTVEIRLSRKG